MIQCPKGLTSRQAMCYNKVSNERKVDTMKNWEEMTRLEKLAAICREEGLFDEEEEEEEGEEEE